MSTLPSVQVEGARLLGWDTYAQAMAVEVMSGDLKRARLMMSPGLIASMLADCERDEHVRGWLASVRAARPDDLPVSCGKNSVKALRAAKAWIESGHHFSRGERGKNELIAQAQRCGVEPAKLKRALNSLRSLWAKQKAMEAPG